MRVKVVKLRARAHKKTEPLREEMKRFVNCDGGGGGDRDCTRLQSGVFAEN